MEERSKTIMCSVLFLDIVEYSKKSVSGQISLKERFNAFLSVAIRDVPLDDRIILDTGDGAALSFIGDVEDALQVALSLRESLRSEGAHMEPPLLVRMGINLGPVRLVKDINGQPNIVGDGINVAQRIMAFSDPGQILVSRSYYDAVSRLSHEYGEMFHYQGSRTDKHVREHEVYAIGYPGEFTSQQPAIHKTGKPLLKLGGLRKNFGKAWQAAAVTLGKAWQTAAQQLGFAVQAMVKAYRAATPGQRAMYGGGMVGMLGLILLAGVLAHRAPAPKTQMAEVASDQQQATPAAGERPTATEEKKAAEGSPEQGKQPSKPKTAATKPSKPAKETAKPATKPATKPNSDGSESERTNIFGMTLPPKQKPGFVSVSCSEGSAIFVDGFSKGVITRGSLTIPLDPGAHRVNITHTGKSTVFSEVVTIKTGETVRLKPSFCD